MDGFVSTLYKSLHKFRVLTYLLTFELFLQKWELGSNGSFGNQTIN